MVYRLQHHYRPRWKFGSPEAAIVEKVLNQLVHSCCCRDDFVHIANCGRVQLVNVIFLQCFGETANRAQRGSQVVRYRIAESLQFGVGTLALGNLNLEIARVLIELIDKLFAIGDVARDFREAEEVSFLVMNR